MNYPTSNVDSTILPLLNICNLTNEYQKNIKQDTLFTNNKVNHQLLTETKGLPVDKTPQLMHLISDCQETFENEAKILLSNDLPSDAVDELFKSYQNFLLTYCLSDYSNNFELPQHRDSLDTSFFSNETLLLDSLDTSASTASLIFDVDNFDLEYVSLSTPSEFISQPSPSALPFQSEQLSDGINPLSLDHLQSFQQQADNIDTHNIETSTSRSDDSQKYSSPNSRITDFFVNCKRSRVSKENKSLLEALFSVKNFPNTAERKLIAEKCNMTPSQVRIWFTNKRARCKGKI